ncbi:hypothetical protein ST45_08570, partial [Prevotella pectinovora]|uniref:hypothetical protein n=1 Tax=Prevotella pectinovora TaxID=1602169 RepID=UPI0005B6D2F8
NTAKQVPGPAAGQMETKKYRSRIKTWAIFFLTVYTSIADTLTFNDTLMILFCKTFRKVSLSQVISL